MSKIRATKQQVYEACERLAIGTSEYSCLALKHATNAYIANTSTEFEIAAKALMDYRKFYGFENLGAHDVWWSGTGDDISEIRQTALLLYAEARDDV